MLHITSQFIFDQFFSRVACANMFKLFLALLSIGFISTSGELLGVIQLEDRANEGRFQLEERYKKPLDEISCNELKSGQAECQLTKHRMKAVETASLFLIRVIVNSSNAAIVLMLLCVVSFVGIPHWEKYNKQLEGAVNQGEEGVKGP